MGWQENTNPLDSLYRSQSADTSSVALQYPCMDTCTCIEYLCWSCKFQGLLLLYSWQLMEDRHNLIRNWDRNIEIQYQSYFLRSSGRCNAKKEYRKYWCYIFSRLYLWCTSDPFAFLRRVTFYSRFVRVCGHILTSVVIVRSNVAHWRTSAGTCSHVVLFSLVYTTVLVCQTESLNARMAFLRCHFIPVRVRIVCLAFRFSFTEYRAVHKGRITGCTK